MQARIRGRLSCENHEFCIWKQEFCIKTTRLYQERGVFSFIIMDFAGSCGQWTPSKSRSVFRGFMCNWWFFKGKWWFLSSKWWFFCLKLISYAGPYDGFCIKNEELCIEKRSCVSKTRNFVSKMMNFAGYVARRKEAEAVAGAFIYKMKWWFFSDSSLENDDPSFENDVFCDRNRTMM